MVPGAEITEPEVERVALWGYMVGAWWDGCILNEWEATAACEW